MKRSLSGIMVILLLTSMLTLALNIQSVETAPVTITVPDDYPTIQEAINAAVSGDTIYVRTGTYYENVVVNKTVSLIGENTEDTIIDGGGTGRVIFVTAVNVAISGFTIRNSGYDVYDAGVWLASSGNEISDNYLSDNSWGIGMEYATSNMIRENSIVGSEHSYGSWGGGLILLEDSDGNTIINNVISCNEDNSI